MTNFTTPRRETRQRRRVEESGVNDVRGEARNGSTWLRPGRRSLRWRTPGRCDGASIYTSWPQEEIDKCELPG